MGQSPLEEKVRKYVDENKTSRYQEEGRPASYPHVYAQFFIQQSKVFSDMPSQAKNLKTYYRETAKANNLAERDMINMLADAYLEVNNIHLTNKKGAEQKWV